jgi:uncharacterized RDD family membrane protein YckC
LPLVLVFAGATSAIAGQKLPRLRELGFGYAVHLAVDGGIAGMIALAISAIVVLLYILIFLVTAGQTPGMRLLRMRVIDAYGDPPSIGRALVRIVGLGLSIGGFFLGCLWIGFSREKRGFHDLLAGTWVVRAEPLSVSPERALDDAGGVLTS